MNYKAVYQTKNVSKGVNSKKYLIIHHTATGPGTLLGVMRTLLGNTPRLVSVQYLCDRNGDMYQLAKDTDVCRHCGLSQWGNDKFMNFVSIGIEVIGINDFTMEQKIAVKTRIREKMKQYNIPKENVLRHCDITGILGPRKILWDGKSTNRKVDIHRNYFSPKYPTWADYQNSL